MPVKKKVEPSVAQSATLLSDKLQAPAICQYWAFRIMLDMNGLTKALSGRQDYLEDRLAELLGVEPEHKAFSSVSKARYLLQTKYQQFLQTTDVALPPVFASNLASIARVAGFNPTEQDVFALIVLAHVNRALKEALELLGELLNYQLADVVSTLLGVPLLAVKEALSPQGTLQKSGLIRLRNYGQQEFCDHFEFVSDCLPNRMMAPLDEPMALLRDLVNVVKEPDLTEKDYRYLGEPVELLKAYLKKVIAKRQSGVNILLYGPPGTGKTELSKVLARALKQELYEVSCANFDGHYIEGSERLNIVRAAQLFLANGDSLLLFDEVEDVFHHNPFRESGKGTKGWINQLLENNQVPTFWLSNNIRSMDPAFIRRFDMVLELPVPPARQRAAILQQASDGLLSMEDALTLTQHQQLSPAVITRASKVVRMLAGKSGDSTKQQFRLLTEATLKAQGCKVRLSRGPGLGSLYDPRLTQADCDLVALTKGLQQAGSGRLCLYGPPGTGKTAFGHYLAQTMSKELLVKKASDLISCWVGGTEQAIAEAFAEATANDTILLLDEVDSFLQERSRARNSWEITAVNEMLTQMEAFDGVFIASTNLMHNLDKAALRRFDLKACFGYLKPVQITRLFSRYCKQLGLTLCKQAMAEATSLPCLTPGDFAAIARKQRFSPIAHARELSAALAAECVLKAEVTSRPIGFVTT